VARIDPETNRVVAVIPVDGGCGGLDAGQSVWVSARSCGRHIARIDPTTNDVTTQVELPGFTLGLAVFRGSVWVATLADGRAALIRIDEQTGLVLGRVDVNHVVGALAVADAVYAAGDGRIIRVEPLEER
jgi:glutamine cyclotransferase